MKTLADFKRWVQPGKKLTLIEHSRGHKDLNMVRSVVTVQTNAFSMLGSNGKECWLDYPKAKEVTFEGLTMTVNAYGCRMVYRLEE